MVTTRNAPKIVRVISTSGATMAMVVANVDGQLCTKHVHRSVDRGNDRWYFCSQIVWENKEGDEDGTLTPRRIFRQIETAGLLR